MHAALKTKLEHMLDGVGPKTAAVLVDGLGLQVRGGDGSLCSAALGQGAGGPVVDGLGLQVGGGDGSLCSAALGQVARVCGWTAWAGRSVAWSWLPVCARVMSRRRRGGEWNDAQG